MPPLREGPCSHCFQDCPAAEKESQVLRIVSVCGGRGAVSGARVQWIGLGLDILFPIPQCSHVAGICHNILSCSPQELLEQKAVLERVQLDNPLVSSDLSPLTSWQLGLGPETLFQDSTEFCTVTATRPFLFRC